MQLCLRLFLILFLLLALSPVAVSAVIDSFDTTQFLSDDSDAGGDSGSVGDGTDITMLGGARDAYVELLSGTANAQLIAASSVGSLSVGFRSVGTGTFQWDGPDGSINLNPTGLGGVDLTESGVMDAFAITTVSADHAHEFSLGVYTSTSSWTEITYTRPVSFRPGIRGNTGSVLAGIRGQFSHCNIDQHQLRIDHGQTPSHSDAK